MTLREEFDEFVSWMLDENYKNDVDKAKKCASKLQRHIKQLSEIELFMYKDSLEQLEKFKK